MDKKPPWMTKLSWPSASRAKNRQICHCLPSNIGKYRPINTKPGLNIYDYKISDKFDYGSNWTRTPELFALDLGKIAEFDVVYTLASTNINQSAPNLV